MLDSTAVVRPYQPVAARQAAHAPRRPSGRSKAQLRHRPTAAAGHPSHWRVVHVVRCTVCCVVCAGSASSEDAHSGRALQCMPQAACFATLHRIGEFRRCRLRRRLVDLLKSRMDARVVCTERIPHQRHSAGAAMPTGWVPAPKVCLSGPVPHTVAGTIRAERSPWHADAPRSIVMAADGAGGLAQHRAHRSAHHMGSAARAQCCHSGTGCDGQS